MSVEQAVVDGLALALAPVPVWFSISPEETDATPPTLPHVIVTNAGMSADAQTTCGTGDLFTVTLQIDVFAYGADEARRLGDRVRALMPTLVACSLDFSQFLYNPDPRAWRVTSDWLCTETAPDLPVT
jgi:hypothetical protein